MFPYFATWAICATISSGCRNDNPMLYDDGITYKHGINTRLAIVVCFFALSLVGGLRYNVGADYKPYYVGYYYFIDNAMESIKSLDEPMINIVCKISSFAYNDPAAGLFLMCVITTGLGLLGIYRHCNDISLGIVLYSLVVWHTSFNAVRQALAVAILTLGIKYIKEKKFFKYLIVVFLAFLSHKSVIVFIVMYFICKLKVTRKNAALLFIGTLIIYFSYSKVLSIMGIIMSKEEYFAFYNAGSNNYLSRSVNPLRIIFEVFPALLFLHRYNECEHTKNDDFNMNLLLVHAAVSVASMGSSYMARMSLFTMPLSIIAISNLIPITGYKSYKYRKVFILAYFAFGAYEVFNNGMLTPFHWIWQR